MIELLIRHFAIILSSLYTYARLLNLKRSPRQILISSLFSLCLSVATCLIKLHFSYISFLSMIVFTFVFTTWKTKTRIELSVTTTVLSFAICYVIYFFSSVLTSGVFWLFDVELSVSLIYLTACSSLLLLLMIRLPFLSRRLKNGMPFLIKKGGGNAGVIISVILLCCGILLSNNKDMRLIYVVPLFMIIFGAVFMLIWWRSRLTREYIETLRSNEIKDLREMLLKKEDQIDCLEQNNQALAKIIHRDNKLIPAMELAVRDFLKSAEQMEQTELKRHGQELLRQLKELSGERSGIIEEYQFQCKTLPKTKVCSVDTLISYMFNKSKEYRVKFDLAILGSIKYMVEKVIPESDLNTVLADLCENAILAAKDSERKSVLLVIGISDGCYSIDVFDSGLPFEIDTLANLGLKKITTRAESGGSGIGLATTFEIKEAHNASFIIEEYNNDGQLFTKKVSLKFDNLNQYLVITKRDDAVKASSQRADLTVRKPD